MYNPKKRREFYLENRDEIIKKSKEYYRNNEHSQDASIRLGGNQGLVRVRIQKLGWTFERAFTIPLRLKLCR